MHDASTLLWAEPAGLHNYVCAGLCRHTPLCECVMGGNMEGLCMCGYVRACGGGRCGGGMKVTVHTHAPDVLTGGERV